MNDYGKGGVLGTATALPATAGMGLLISNSANEAIVIGFLIASFIGFVVLLGSVSRFVINYLRIR